MIKVTDTTIENKKIPASFDGFRIVHVTDLHDAMFGEGQSELLQKIIDQNPDIIVLTEDFIGEKDTDPTEVILFLKKLPQIAQCFYVTGNHEYRLTEEHYTQLVDGIREAGISFLKNQTEEIARGYEKIQVLGVEDPALMGEQHRALDGPKLAKEIRETAFDPDMFSLLLVHRPEHIRVYAESGIDLVLCGHSHGGQMRLPLIGAFYVPSQGLFPKYDRGLFTVGETQMFISSGLGNSVVNMRVLAPPEIGLITLRSVPVTTIEFDNLDEGEMKDEQS